LLPRTVSTRLCPYGSSLLCLSIVGLAAVTGAAEKPAYTRTTSTVTVPVNGANVVLRPLEDGAIRVQIAALGETPASESVVFIHTAFAPRFTVRETPQTIIVDTGALRASVSRENGALTFADANGKVLLQEKEGGRIIPPPGTQAAGTAAQDTFLSPHDEYLFGTGQFQDGYLNVRGLPRRLTQVNSQIAIPFLLSSKGYGLLWHNYGLTDLNPADTEIRLTQTSVGAARRADVTTSSGTQSEQTQEAVFSGEFDVKAGGPHALMLDVGQKMARHYHVEIDDKAEVDFANYWLPPTTSWLSTLSTGKHSVRVIGEVQDRPVLFLRPANDLTTLRSANARFIDYVVFAGPKSDDVIRRYRDLTGAAPLMPNWAYGYIHCRERFHSQQELIATLKEFRSRQLALDVIVQDWQYWGKYGWNAMQFDEKDYPDPHAMVESIHDMHARLMVSVWSRIDPSSAVGKEFTQNHYYIPGTDWVDFFNPDAASLYWKDMSSHLLTLGIDAWWQDATEPENDDLHGRTVAAGSGDAVRLLYPLFVNKTVYEGQRKDAPDKRVFILTRSAFSGQQRYASATWSGDVGSGWDTLKREITAGLDFSASGLPYWTTDTGGFFRPGSSQYADPAYQERLLRWLEFSTFTPLMRVHGYQTDTEFWRFGPQVESVARKYLDMRYQMLPYLYSEAAAVTMKGSTLLRPLVMDFASDLQALQQNYEFMFGHDLLIAPVIAPSTSRMSVYLPQNPHGWFNFWSGAHMPGNVTLITDAKLDQIPLFVPAGSILPFGPKEQYVSEKRSDPIELRIYPGADTTFTLYEDEGTNYNYEHGAFSLIQLRWNERNQELVIGKRTGSYPGMRHEREFSVQLIGSSAKTQVVVYQGRELHVSLK
jgi:alpha-D-xyloside xylohydrolase